MATLPELASLHTDLDEPTVDHLLRLTASWSLLADLSFSDMLLMAKVGPAPSGADVDSGAVLFAGEKRS